MKALSLTLSEEMNLTSILRSACTIFLSAVSLILLQECHPAASEGGDSADLSADTIKKEILLTPETQDILNHFPTPLDLAVMLEKAKAPYLSSLCNSPDSLGRYFTSRTKALNLGVYSADLAYASVYGRMEECRKYLYCISKLCDDLGIAPAFNEHLTDRAMEFKDNRDSLQALARNFFRETGDFLRKNNRNQVAVLAVTGAFAEGIYIACSIAESSPENKDLLLAVAGQKENYVKLMRILKEYGHDSNVWPVTNEMELADMIFTISPAASVRQLTSSELNALRLSAWRLRTFVVS